MDINDLKGDAPVITLDDITDRFKTKTQRQDYYEPKEVATSEGSTNIYDPYGETTSADYSGGWDDTMEQEKTISPERAHRTGERIAKVIDAGFNFFASNMLAKTGKDYKAKPADLQDIADAWGDMAHDKQWEFSPALQLLVLYIMVYSPLMKEALNDRRLMEMEERLMKQEEKIREMENEHSRNRSQEAKAEAGGNA
ncbi:MAG: hypothetical protein J6R17_01335 [Bacteroidales bacterium]|nr:hypothetical protein [Bacteroidales bacterium]